MNKIIYLTRPQIYKVTKEFLTHCKKNVYPVTSLTSRDEMFLWNRDKTLYVKKDNYEMETQAQIFKSVFKNVNLDLKEKYKKDDVSNSFLYVFRHYVFNEEKILTIDEWVYDWTNRRKICTTYCFKVTNIPILNRRVRFNSNIFIDKISRIRLFKSYLQDKKQENKLIDSTIEKDDTALAIRVQGCESKKTYGKAINLAQKIVDWINLAYGMQKYPLQIRNWSIKEKENYIVPKYYETDAISVFINNAKRIEAISFEPHSNLEYVTQNDLRKIKDFIAGIIQFLNHSSENVLIKRYQIAFNWLGQAIRDKLQYRGFLQGMISLDTFLSRERVEIKKQSIVTPDGRKIALFTAHEKKGLEVNKLTWKKVQVADIVSFIEKDISFSQQEIFDYFIHYGELRDKIVHDGITTIDKNEYKIFFTLTISFFVNVLLKIINNNISTVEELWNYCHPEIINNRLKSLENKS